MFNGLDQYGRQGVNALARATPQDTGLAASSWNYNIERKPGHVSIIWTNSNVENGFHVVVGLQYGHGTRGGGWVQGIDIVNPSMRPIFEQILESVWKEVTRA